MEWVTILNVIITLIVVRKYFLYSQVVQYILVDYFIQRVCISYYPSPVLDLLSPYFAKLLQLFLILCDPRIVDCQAPLPMGFSGQEYCHWFPGPPPGDVPNPEIKLSCLMFPVLASGFFTTSTTWEAHTQVSFFAAIFTCSMFKILNIRDII